MVDIVEKAGDNRLVRQADRQNYIDVMRGIGILLVMLGHSIATINEPTNKLILSFHMPLFFFISGMLFYNREFKKPGKFFYGKFRRLIVPQIVMALITIVVSIIIDVILTKDLSLKNVQYLGAFDAWFLIALFIVDSVMYVVLKISKKPIYLICLTVVFFIGFLLLSYKEFHIQQALCALFFAMVGYLSKKYLDLYALKYSNFMGIGFLLLAVTAILTKFNSPVAMYMNDYGNKLLFAVTAIIGILAIFDISVTIEKVKILQFFGINSLIVYVTHAAILRVLHKAITVIGLPHDVYPNYYIVFLSLLVIEIGVVWLVNKMCPWLFGIQKKVEK